MNRRTILLGVLLALVGCSTTTTTASTPSTAAPATKTSVVVIGDSITDGSRQQVNDALAFAGYTDIVIEAVSGRRIAIGDGTTEPLAGVNELQNVLAIGAQPAVWVIELGSNDIGKYPESDYPSLIDSITAQIPPTVPLVWVDVYVEHDLTGTAQFNDLLRARLADRGHATVAPWFESASDPAQAVLQDDRLHPNDAGRQRLAALIVDATAMTT